MVNTRLRNAALALLTFMAFLIAMTWAADHANAAEGTYLFDDFAIPNPTRPPTVRTLLTIDTSEIAGQTCQIVVDTVNGESVHPENYITVTGGVPTITVTGTEDGAFGVKQNTTTVVMGDSLVVNNHFQRATSVEGDVIISCQDESTTTTSEPVPTSTTFGPSTTTSQPATTTTTAPATTTTTPTPSTSTTTAPDTSTTTSPSSSTTSPDGSTSTTAPPTGSTEPPPSTPPTLPNTGPADVVGLAMAGIALLALGGGIVLAVREGTRG